MISEGNAEQNFPLLRKALLRADLFMHDLLAFPELQERADALHDLIHDASAEVEIGVARPESERWAKGTETAVVPRVPIEADWLTIEQSVAQYRKDSADEDGFWRTCSGCYECEDGYPNGPYPHSEALGCTLGGGCSDCGGIGATWDTIDYDQMAREMLAEDCEELAAEDARSEMVRAALASPVAGITREGVEQEIAGAFEAGCRAVHENYQEDRDPDFAEAADDYVRSLNLVLLTPSATVDREALSSTDTEAALIPRHAIVAWIRARASEAYEAVEHEDDPLVTVSSFMHGLANDLEAGALLSTTETRGDIVRETVERCARLAEKRHEHWRMPHPDDARPGEVCCDVSACEDIAAAIRDQGGEG